MLNLTTGSITTQFHVVFDDMFTTVNSIAREDQPPSHWNDLCLENTELVPMDNPPSLTAEWLSEMDSNLDTQMATRTNQVRSDLTTNHQTQREEKLFLPNSCSSSEEVGTLDLHDSKAAKSQNK